MPTRHPFAVDEWYHCFNRGVDKRKVFHTSKDYNRFLSLLFLCNSTERLHLSDYKTYTFHELLAMPLDQGNRLVDIGAWCLMSNHIHLLLKQRMENGIALFMQKVFTGYTMYFNQKNDRTGALFAGTFKSKHISDDRYLQHLVGYIHMNPLEVAFPDWETGTVTTRDASSVLDRYTYSSLHSFENKHHKERILLGNSIFEVYDKPVRRIDMLKDARKYFTG